MDLDFISFLRSQSINESVLEILKENEVDWSVCHHLTDTDWHTMLPGKVGIVAKIKLLMKSCLEEPSCNPAPETTAPAEKPSASNPPVSTSVRECEGTADTAGAAVTGSNMPLPTYSQRVASMLTSGNIMSELDRMVEETAYHILSNGDITTRDGYEVYGRRLYELYPSIQFPGNEPWSFFCRKLSQKLRNIRWRRNVRSMKTVSACSSSGKKARSLMSTFDKDTAMSLEDCLKMFDEHMLLPQQERDMPYLMKLWCNEAFFNHRRQRIAALGAGQVQELIGFFPLLDNLLFIHADMKRLCQVQCVDETFSQLMSSLSKVLEVDKNSYGSEEEFHLELLLLAQERMQFKLPKKTQKLEAAISIVPLIDVNLTTGRKSPPRLVITADDGQLTNATIIGDGLQVPVDDSPPVQSAAEPRVCTMLMNLLSVYYVWDLCFPKQYQILVFLQMHLLKDFKDKSSTFKSSAFLKFDKVFCQQ